MRRFRVFKQRATSVNAVLFPENVESFSKNDAASISVGFVVTPALSRLGGGIASSASRLARGLFEEGARVEAFGLNDAHLPEDAAQWLPIQPRAFEVRGPRALGFAPGLRDALASAQLDLLHTHGIWMHPSRDVFRSHKPYLVTPHGMLDAWALKNSRWKKRIAAMLFENTHLRRAACIHALCRAEAESIRAYGLQNPICVIPNGIDLPDASIDAPAPWLARCEAKKKTVIYLGRIHPKKNLASLLEAWKQAASQQIVARDSIAEWQLVIAGWDQNGHEAELKSLAQKLGIARDVHFIGPIFGNEKAAAYGNADAFILPSVSEGLPMVVLEAWAHAKPVLITPQCNLPEGFAARAALRIEPEPSAIARGLRELFGTSAAERDAIGKNGLKLVTQQFSWPRISREMLAVYRWIIGRGEKPACVC